MDILKLQEENVSTKQLLLFIFVAYIFSILVRMIWVYWAKDIPSFYYDGQIMINTNDGYYFASGAQKAIDGIHQLNPRVPSWLNNGMIFLTTLIAKYTPLSLDSVILYLPAIISSIVVVPVILIGRLYRVSILGFFAALIGSIAWSYYNRTMIGYYDTDMFSAMAPMFILYFLMHAVEHRNINSALYGAIAIAIYPFLYDQGLSIVYAMGIIYFLYMLVFHRNEKITYISIILISLSLVPFTFFASSPVSYILKILFLFVVYTILKRDLFSFKQLVLLATLSVVLFFTFGNVFGLIWAKVYGYIHKGTENSNGLNFFSVSQTVREAGKIPFSVMANRISGSTIGVIVSLIGYILLVIRYRPFILALPLIGIGVFSLWGGLRFTVYAVPVAAISAVYLFYVIANFSDKKLFRYGLTTSLTALMIYPNIDHIIKYKVPTVFNSEEVKALTKLSEIASDKDYTLTWWDYGYPIWYYSNTNTLIDGGKHDHDNFIISKILNTSSQTQAVNLARLAVESYVDSNYSIVADKIFEGKDPNDFLLEMQGNDFKLPKKTRDIYLYLPQRLLNIFPTVGLFSNLDLKSGKRGKQPFFYKANRFKDDGKFINFGSGLILEKDKGLLHIGQGGTQIKRFSVVGYDKSRKIHADEQIINPNGEISIIFMQSYGAFLIVDENIYNSLFIQMFVFEHYDKDLFEPVVMSPYSKIYKLKK